MHFNNIALFNKTAVALTLSSLLAVPAMAQSISGRVLDQQGQPVSNAEIHIDKQQRHVFTNEQGYFSLDNVNAGITKLHVSANKFIHYNNNYTVTENDISGLEIVLTHTVMEIIDVHATPLHSSIIESALPLNVIAGDELRMKQASTLGETLKNEVGVHSSYYGPVSSSPIIRGLDGPRVLVSQNGLDVGDASRVGADHVVAAETSTATQIEVLRGPATLFYGSGAIGGVVNIVDNRVPTSSDTTAEWQLQHNDVADEDEASFNINTGTENFAFHADAFWRDSNDYDIPGLAELETEEEHEEHEDEEDHHEGSGTLANSAAKSSGFTLGSSYLLDNGYIGFSYGRMDREYGIPGHSHGGHEDEHEEEHDDEHGEEEHHEEGEENVFAKLKQDRFQMISDINLSDQFLSRVATKVAYTDYQHQEIEDGAVGTTFENESIEARMDLHHQVINGFNGAWTLHYKSSDFSADGEEAFTPPTETSSIALGWIEEKHYGDWLVQFGARIEHVTIEADGHGFGEEHHDEEHDEHEEEHDEHEDEHHDEEHEEVAFEKQTFTPISVSFGGVWDYEPGYNIGISAAYSQRAPSGTELFANGPHIGTNTFEVGALYDLHVEGDEVHADLGDQNAELETSYNFDLTWRKFEGDFGFVISAFYNHVNDYYYQQETGFFIEAGHDHEEEHEEDHADEHGEEEHGEEGLPVFIYQQDDVDMYGLEAEFVYQVSAPLKATVFADYIKAELSDGGKLPRIPPMRLGGQLNYQADNFAAELSVSHYFEQDQIAEFETNTDSYTMVDANVNFYLDGVGFKDMETVVFIKGQNLTDEDARVHSSFLKNVAPLPGRGISVGIRGSF